VGLGPTAGIMGLWFHTTGVFVKYLSEQFEAGGRDILGAALVDGATRWQAYLYVLLPAEANAALSFLLYYYEANFRQATFLSMVGAGGIGIELSAAVGRFDYGRTGLIVLTVIAVSVALDFTSRLLRARLT
jgi:phosphonate transport system permease protein